MNVLIRCLHVRNDSDALFAHLWRGVARCGGRSAYGECRDEDYGIEEQRANIQPLRHESHLYLPTLNLLLRLQM